MVTEEILENIEIYLSLAGVILSLVVSLIVFIIKFIKAIKNKKAQQDEVDLLDAVAPIMEIAETFTHYSGEEKKEYVLTKINQLAIENGVDYDSETVTSKIEELIKLSKQVNSKK